MKKVLALVICIAMIACVAVTASAEATPATFTVSTVEGKAGDVVTVDINIAEKGTRIGTFVIQINYDTDYLKFVENEDEGAYFVVGEATNAATAAGNEENMQVALATPNGFFKAGKVLTLAFEITKEIPQGEIAEVTFEMMEDPKVCDEKEYGAKEYDVKINAGGVKAPYVEPSQDPKPPVGPSTVDPSPVDPSPVDPSKPAESDTDTNPATGDVTGIAVAAGLCAVMAAAFVITKKVND